MHDQSDVLNRQPRRRRHPLKIFSSMTPREHDVTKVPFSLKQQRSLDLSYFSCLGIYILHRFRSPFSSMEISSKKCASISIPASRMSVTKIRGSPAKRHMFSYLSVLLCSVLLFINQNLPPSYSTIIFARADTQTRNNYYNLRHSLHLQKQKQFQHATTITDPVEKKNFNTNDQTHNPENQEITLGQFLSTAVDALSSFLLHNDYTLDTTKSTTDNPQPARESSTQKAKRHRQFQRSTMMIPPAPVTPFRGGLKTVQDPNKPNSELTLEANSSDNGDERKALLSSPSSKTMSSWTPEEYPDPWTNPIVCGGTATASMLNDEEEVQHNTQQSDGGDDSAEDREFRHWFYIPPTLGNSNEASPQSEQDQQPQPKRSRLLFCDPDQVLDKETLRDVATKLQAFSETFALHDPPVDSQEVDSDFDPNTENGESEYQHENPQSSTYIDNLSPSNENEERLHQSNDVANSETAKENFEDLGLEWSPVEEEEVQTGQGTKTSADETANDSEDSHESLPDAAKEEEMLDLTPDFVRKLSRSAFEINPSEATKRLYSDSVGGVYSTLPRETGRRNEESLSEPVEVAIALVKKINLPAILRADSYFFYSDQDDMVNDAAQYFARYIHDTWSKQISQQQQTSSADLPQTTNLVLIFISTQDRICYISSGTRISTVLPWWRLEHVVQDMKPDLRKGNTGDALGIAIDDLSALLQDGPPTFLDRVNDFLQRFGLVMMFTTFTFLFATWGECRDRRKRLFFAIRRSRMTAAEKEKARLLQREFKTKMCPICLEPFESNGDKESDDDKLSIDKEKVENKKQKLKTNRVDSYGLPILGTDDLPIKLLRCGHIFDESCWKAWVDSGHGNPWICPVCRQDVGRVKTEPTSRQSRREDGGGGRAERGGESVGREESTDQRESSMFASMAGNTPASVPSTLLRPVSHSHPNYNSLHQSRTQHNRARWSEPQPNTGNATFVRLLPMRDHSSATETIGEGTPLFVQTSNASNEDEDDY